jgi:hypothetical protein
MRCLAGLPVIQHFIRLRGTGTRLNWLAWGFVRRPLSLRPRCSNFTIVLQSQSLVRCTHRYMILSFRSTPFALDVRDPSFALRS